VPAAVLLADCLLFFPPLTAIKSRPLESYRRLLETTTGSNLPMSAMFFERLWFMVRDGCMRCVSRLQSWRTNRVSNHCLLCQVLMGDVWKAVLHGDVNTSDPRAPDGLRFFDEAQRSELQRCAAVTCSNDQGLSRVDW
jgi:hypothetical protein